MVAYDYTQLADLYDLFCTYDGDVEFLRRWTTAAHGRALELMAGTGRLSLPLRATGAELVSLDLNLAMLRVLRSKVTSAGPPLPTVCADVARLPLASDSFDLVLLPFQGLSELVDRADRTCLISEAARVLRPGGTFVCSTHNPTVRRRTVDGQWHHVGTFPVPGEGRIELSLWTVADGTERVRGRQRVHRFDAAGELVERREVELEFSLPPPDEVVDSARRAGLTPVELLGDLEGNPFVADSSPCLIAVLGKQR